MGTVAIVVILLALCGFIAYIGDLIGRRLGKKRLSVFGLRPKHTAILLTVVTGVVIAGVTFCAALVTLPWFRKVVTQGERLANQNTRLRSRNEQLARVNGEREQQNRQLEARNQLLQQQKGRLSGEIHRLQTDNGKLQADNGKLQTQSAALRTQTADLQKANAEIHRHNEELRQRTTELALHNRDLLAQKSGLDKEIRGLRQQVTDARHEASRYQGMLYNLPRNWQLAGVPIPKNPPADVLRSTLRNLMFRAREGATKHKAAPSRGREVVYLLRPPDYPAGRPVTTEAILDWAAVQMARIHDLPLGARLLTAANCLPGESVPLRLDWYVNEQVFNQGEVIAARVIDGGGSRGMVLEDLLQLLKGDVSRTALNRSMYPQEDDDAFGELRYDELLNLCDKLLATKGPALVEVVARKDIRRSGPLYVDFRIKPA